MWRMPKLVGLKKSNKAPEVLSFAGRAGIGRYRVVASPSSRHPIAPSTAATWPVI